MCGIFISNKPELKPEFIKQYLHHRGPDWFSYKKVDDIYLFHSRLSITGETGEQPFNTPDNACLFVVNGEFYDFKSIKKKFPDYPFKLNSDSEIIAPLYQQYGLTNKFFEHLNGEYAFAIYDRRKNKIFLSRDTYGVKPLFYSIHKNHFFIGSEAKSLMPFVNKGWNYDALKQVLSFQYHDNHSSLFKGIFQVPPGKFIEIDTFTLTVKTHDIPKKENLKNNNKVSEKDVFEKLTQSILRRTETTKPIAFTLSGGIDSSAIASLANKPYGSKAFSVSFENGKQYDELKLAQSMAESINLNFNPIIVNEKTLIDNLEKSIYASESISINSHVAAKYMMFNEIKNQGFKISISGEGADEMFGGYSHFSHDMGFSNQQFKHLKGMHLPEGASLDDSVFLEKMGFTPTFAKAKLSMGYKMHKLLKDDFIKDYENSLKELFTESFQKQRTDLQKSTALWSNVCFSNYILNTLGDRLEMAHSIEGRTPFLDKEIIELTSLIKDEQKINKNGEKQILRKALKDTLPDFIVKQNKQPFVSPPLIDWQKNTFFLDYMEDILHCSFFKNSEVFDIESIHRLFNHIRQNPHELRSYDNVLMIILSVYIIDKKIIKGPNYE